MTYIILLAALYSLAGLYVGWRQWLWAAPRTRPVVDSFACFFLTPPVWPIVLVLHVLVSRMLGRPHLAPRWFGKIK